MTILQLSFKSVLYFMVLVAMNNTFLAQNGILDSTFNSGDNGFSLGDGPDNGIQTSCIQPDGKIIIGGNFSNYNSVYNNHIARINADGTLDNSFVSGSGAWAIVNAIAIQPDGKIIIAGYFTYYNGTPVNRIARLNSDGTIDAGFSIGTGANGTINSIALQPDGKIVIGGSFTAYNGVFRNNIARINSTGTLDGTFTVGNGIYGLGGYINKVKLQPDGKVIVAGNFSFYNGTARNNIVRLSSTGIIDTTFDPLTGSNAQIVEIGIQTDGKILLGGSFTSFAGNPSNRACRINSDGSFDSGFNIGSGFDANVNSLNVQSDGKIVFAGDFSTFNGLLRNKILRLNNDGSLDTPYANDFNASGGILSTVLQSDGKVLVGGGHWEFNGYTVNGLNRLNTDGALDLTFNPSTSANGIVYSTAIQPDGKIIVGGDFTGYFWTTHRKLIRVNSDGTIDPTFNNSGIGFNVTGKIEEVKLLADGKILVAGNFSSYNGIPISCIARINSDGSLDPTFNPGTSAGGNTIYDLIILGSGKYMIGGTFTSYNGTAISNVARLNQDGSLDYSFNIGTGSNWAVRTVVEQADGKVIVGGYFSAWNGAPRNRLVRLNTDGSIDNTFIIGTGAGDAILETTLQTDGKILIGGQFTTFNGVARNRIARLNSDGSLDSSFDPGVGPNQSIAVIKQQSNGKLLVGGEFTMINSTSINGIARFYSNGTLDPSFGAINSLGQNEWVVSIEQQADENLIIAGGFKSFNGIGRNRIARITNCVSSIGTDIQTACEPYTWIDGNIYPVSNNTAYHTIMSATNCDSLVYLNLTILSPTFASQTANACSNYTWPLNGETYSVSGNYIDTLINSVGCDSIVTLTLSINNTFATQTETACNSYFWSINNNIYSISGLYIDTIPNYFGCDSIITLNLTIQPPTYGTDVQNICDSLTWIDGITYYSNNNTATHIIPNAVGCDSIITLNLTILQPTNSTETHLSCDSLMWLDGITYYASNNTATHTIPNAAGCDSIITLNLTILQPTYGTDVQTVCDSLTWIDGITYYSNNTTATHIIPNVTGCDSIITLNFTIIPAQPLILENSFSLPSDANNCIGQAAITVSGNADFELNVDNGLQVVISIGYSVLDNLCPGVHDLKITDNCGDTLHATLLIPVDSNYVYNNPYLDSMAVDSLGATLTNCAIYYNSIDTAYIDSVWSVGNIVNVVWNIVDANGSNYDTSSYVLNNGNGVYLLQLSVFCPNKAFGDYFAVTQAIYFENGSVFINGIDEKDLHPISIHPNPTNDYILITSANDDIKCIIIYDLYGKELQNEVQNGNAYLINLNDKPTGIYLFNIITTKGEVTKRVVKQ